MEAIKSGEVEAAAPEPTQEVAAPPEGFKEEVEANEPQKHAGLEAETPEAEPVEQVEEEELPPEWKEFFSEDAEVPEDFGLKFYDQEFKDPKELEKFVNQKFTQTQRYSS